MSNPCPSHPARLVIAFGIGSLLVAAGCGPAPDRRITPAEMTPEQIRQVERDLDAAAASEKTSAPATER